MKSLHKTKIGNAYLISMLIVIFGSGTTSYGENIAAKTSKNMQKLWEARVTSPEKQKNITTAERIQKLISKIDSLDFEKQTTDKEEKKKKQPDNEKTQSQKVKKQQQTENAREKTKKTSDEEKQKSKIREEENSEKKRIEKLVEELSANPEDAENPLELAHILFRGGYPEQAGVFYESALKQLSPTDKAWVLFQIGNCFENSNPSKAEKAYKKLLVKYKDCEWSKSTESKLKILQFKRENKPDELISRSRELSPVETENNRLLSEAK